MSKKVYVFLLIVFWLLPVFLFGFEQEKVFDKYRSGQVPLSSQKGDTKSFKDSGFTSCSSQKCLEREQKIPVQGEKFEESKSKSVEKTEKPYVLKGEFEEGQVVSGVYYKVTPEKTTMIEMSNVDINRIVCPINIQDVIFSEEKGVVVNVVGRNAFVKFKVKKVNENFEYSKTPVDIHVVCGGKVYSIIAFPKKIPAVLVYLEDKETLLKSSLESISKLNFEERLVYYVKEIFAGRVPFEAEPEKVNVKHNVFKDLEIVELVRYVIEGEGIVLKFFSLKYVGNDNYIDLNERLFLKKELTVSPLAVSLSKLRLSKGETAELIIIEKKLAKEKES